MRFTIRSLPAELLSDAAFLARFEAGFDRGAPDACWHFGRRPGYYGYVSWKIDGRRTQITASRIALALKLGRWPKHLACHDCDRPSCVNPAHLFDGTHADNMRDMVAKGRTWDAQRRAVIAQPAANS